MKIWKRNAVLMTVLLFVCVALYMSWSYNREDSIDPLDVYLSENLDNSLDAGADSDLLQEFNVSVAGEDAMDMIGANDGQTDVDVQPEMSADNFFSETRLSRKQARDSALELLREAADKKESDQSVRDKATADIENLAQSVMSEARIEQLVRAKGFDDCVAIISGDGIRIVVASPEGGLLATDVAKIKDIVIGETDLPVSGIHISEAVV